MAFSKGGSSQAFGLNSIQRDCTGADFVMGDLTLHRTWNVDPEGYLVGVSHPTRWTPGINMAVCGSCGAKNIRTPDSTHYCNHDTAGFYAYHDGNEVYSGDVYGIIKAYGLTTVGRKGVRAEKAEIVALYDPTYVKPKNAEPVEKPKVRLKPHDWLSKKMWPSDKAADTWGFGVGLAFILICCWAIPFGFVTGIFSALYLAAVLLPLAAISINAELAAAKRIPPKPSSFSSQSISRRAAFVDWEGVHKRYPDVLYYNDRAEMLAAHPLNKE